MCGLSALWNNIRLAGIRERNFLACAVIGLVALAAYANSFSGPFVFDDLFAVVNNPTIQRLWPIGKVITPLEGGITVGGRPILNLSFAINYAIGGLSVWGYHAVNLGIHILAAIVLYGFLRRTLLRPALSARFGADSWALALAIAVLWVLHPLQTESVTYIVQRAESLGGLFYLLTLYCFVRGIELEGNRGWLWAAVLSCAVGMGCKETMATAPLVVWLYDRTFVAGTFREALRRRWAMYVTMASTWLLLAYFILAAGKRGDSADLAASATTLGYFQTQCYAIFHYLCLAVWPHPLVFDYGTPIIADPLKFAGPAILLFLLGVAALVGVYRRTLWGFFGCWFFAVLAPSSSIVAVLTQTMAEHRMYLPLAAVLAIVVLALYERSGRKCLVFCLFAALVLAWLTVVRNNDYRTEFSLWDDTVRKRPTNARALGNLGTLYLKAGQPQKAKALVEKSIRLNPNYAEPRIDLGIILCTSGRMNEGIVQFRYAVQINPSNVGAQTNLAMGLVSVENWGEARFHFEEILRLDPGNTLAQKYLEYVRGRMGGIKQ